MKLLEIFRFELRYQARRVLTWLYLVALVGIAYQFVRGNYLPDAMVADFYVNSPFIIAGVTVFCTLFWLIVAPGITGEIAARDVETRMHPLTYTSPVSKTEYLGGRFLAAFVLNTLLLLSIFIGVLLAVYLPGVDAEVVGPFRPAAYLTAFAYLMLPNAFIGTAIQFACATLGRRAIGSYLGSVLLLFVAYGGIIGVMKFLQNEQYAAWFDVMAHATIVEAATGWTPIEKSTRLIPLDAMLLKSRIGWTSAALGVLALTWARFRFAHHAPRSPWSRVVRRRDAHAPTPGSIDAATRPVAVPHVARTFGLGLYVQQTLAIAWTSFRTIAKSRAGLIVLVVIAALTVRLLPENLENMGTPLLPTTAYLLTFLTTPLTNALTVWVVIPLLIVLWSGELVWREREAGLGEISDAAPVPEWALFGGRFLGLALVLAVWMMMLMLAGILIQLIQGYHDLQIGLYLKVLFGLQLPEYLLFAVLALAVQGMMTQKYVGHLATTLVFALIAFAPWLGIRHNLLVYAGSPGWSYSDMRGFGATLGPWAWFKAYWAAWAVLLAIAARLLWVRGKESGVRTRLTLARGRFTRSAAGVTAVAAALILGLGGFIFYNTNVLNDYASAFGRKERAAEYEQRYARYAHAAQPRLADMQLRVEIYPDRRAAEIGGMYRLVNRASTPIDSIHVATVPGVETGAIRFDRPARGVVVDDEHGHRVYRLGRPLRPGDSLRFSFTVKAQPRGFRNGGAAVTGVVANGTWFTSGDFLPAIGYQARRELFSPGDRRAHGLPKRPVIPTLADAQDVTGEEGNGGGAERVVVDAVVGTVAGQVAIAPGLLRRSWTESGRRYFHYATPEPIGNEFGFFSARYAVREERWNGVPIQIFHHPGHTANVGRLMHSARASLDRNSREFGPYPYSYLRLIENPVRRMGAHAEATTIDYGQGFALFNPKEDPRGLDFPFAIISHEMGHEWGVPIAFAEGAPLLTESFAWYAAMGVVEETYGREHLRRLLRFFRQPSPIPPIRQSQPLLRAADPYAAYRKGPFALYALSEYAGTARVNLAWRRYYAAHRPDGAPLATSLDLYRELQAATPDSLRYLVHDLFAANTFWQLKTERATARQIAGGAWEVTLRIRARKVTVDPAGKETEVPMNEWIPIGVFAPTAGRREDFGETLYLRNHRIRSGQQTITVTVPRKPSDAGIDPYVVLIDIERYDNVEKVQIEQ